MKLSNNTIIKQEQRVECPQAQDGTITCSDDHTSNTGLGTQGSANVSAKLYVDFTDDAGVGRMSRLAHYSPMMSSSESSLEMLQSQSLLVV